MVKSAWIVLSALVCVGTLVVRAHGEEAPPWNTTVKNDAPVKSVAEITELAKKSVVAITVAGRDGAKHGIGSGFVIDKEGLIATNLHVIGEARPVEVQFSDGKSVTVTAIHASDRQADLAILKVDAKDLPALELGDATKLKQGEDVLALGNPLGLKLSVVTGVVSALREVEGREMIQVAMPIEQGNSGGPLLDRQGRVQGIITLKSLRSPNLGFAVTVNQLKPLLAHPNSITMQRWLTIGILDPKHWKTLFGSHWRQRAGRMRVDGTGDGFGGRSLCLSTHKPEKLPVEVGAFVKLEQEAGAAGIAFHADGGEKHFGFYPSAGKIRLTRFDGPDVLQWHVLQEIATPAYLPGEWNHLKVRLEEGRIVGYVNDQQIVDYKDSTLSGGMVGLAKFRDTVAEFRSFQVGAAISTHAENQKLEAELRELLKKDAVDIKGLIPSNAPNFANPEGIHLLRKQAKQMEQQAHKLRDAAGKLHENYVRKELAGLLQRKPEEVSLSEGALLVAKLDNEEVDVAGYLQEIQNMGRELKNLLPMNATEEQKRDALHRYLFTELGFHGSRSDYYHRSNSYLNEVMDDREGLPITLAVLYLDLAKQCGMKVEGVGVPGHFMVAQTLGDGKAVYVDVFDKGEVFTKEQIEKQILTTTGEPAREEQFKPYSVRQTLARMLNNLFGAAQDKEETAEMLKYAETLVAVDPEGPDHRIKRAILRFQVKDYTGALEDVTWVQEKKPAGIDQERLWELRSLIERGLRSKEQ